MENYPALTATHLCMIKVYYTHESVFVSYAWEVEMSVLPNVCEFPGRESWTRSDTWETL